MRKDEAVVTPDRRGLNWDHPFMKKLKIEIEKKLQPLVDLEKKEREKYKKGISKDTLKRNETLGKKLGKLYKEILKEEELGPLSGEEPSNERERFKKPQMGFEFIPDFYTIECKKEQKIRLVIESPKIFPSYEKVTFESDNKEIVLEKESSSVSEGEYVDEKGVYIHRIGVLGNKAGEVGKIIAKTKDKRGEEHTVEAEVHVRELEGYPPNGFSFVPTEYRVKIEKPSKLTLKIDRELISNDYMKIKITSNNEYVVLDTSEITIPKGDGINERMVVVRGTRTGEIATVTALDLDTPSRKAEAIVKVISVISTSSPKGFEIEFDESYPIQRSVCKGNIIYIFTKKPTVKMYYGDEGEYDKTLSFQVICADLITDAFCAKVVEDLGEKIVYLGGDKETAIRRKLNQLKKRYSPTIHRTYVDKSLLISEREKEGVFEWKRTKKIRPMANSDLICL